jgi:uncharacterized protein involved in type VI secretion and phage assembly
MSDSKRDPVHARHFGVHSATVVDVVDPEGLGRVRAELPWATDTGGTRLELWARLATLMAGADRGSWFIPEVGDEVLLAFEAGDLRHPYVVGALWNGGNRPPEQMDGSGENNIKSLCSRSGVRITFDDTAGDTRLTLETPAGCKVELGDAAGRIEIEDASGNRIRLDAAGVTVEAVGTAKIAAAQLTVDAAMSTFSGVVKCDTMISNSVVAASYTPGVGNIS